MAECYLQDNLATWYTCLLCRSIYKKQRDTRRQREQVVKEREKAQRLRSTAKKQREAAYMRRAEVDESKKESRSSSEEAIMQAEEAVAQLREAECQSQEAVLQSQNPVNSLREELSRERERASRVREEASRQREEESRQREMLHEERGTEVAVYGQQDSRNTALADVEEGTRLLRDVCWGREDDARQRDESNRQLARALARQKEAQDSAWNPTNLLSKQGYSALIQSILPLGEHQHELHSFETSTWRIHRLFAFLQFQSFACAQTIALVVLIAGLALIGIAHIKFGLVAEGAFLILITCGGKLVGLGPSTFVHFMLVPPDYCD